MSPFIPQTLPLKSLDWTRFIPLIGPANAAVARYDGILKAIPNPQILLSPFTTNEAVLSSRIEGTQATLEEVLEFDAQAKPKQEPNPDVREVLNYRRAMHEWLVCRVCVPSVARKAVCVPCVARKSLDRLK